MFNGKLWWGQISQSPFGGLILINQNGYFSRNNVTRQHYMKVSNLWDLSLNCVALDWPVTPCHSFAFLIVFCCMQLSGTFSLDLFMRRKLTGVLTGQISICWKSKFEKFSTEVDLCHAGNCIGRYWKNVTRHTFLSGILWPKSGSRHLVF